MKQSEMVISLQRALRRAGFLEREIPSLILDIIARSLDTRLSIVEELA